MSPDVIGWIASVVFLARLLPQPIRLARTGVPDGVSPLGAINSAVSDIAWVLYGLAAALVPVWAVAAAALLPGVATVVLLRRRIARADLLGGGAWLAVILASASVGRLGIVLTASVLVNQGPQVWTAIRSNRLVGIARTTWYIALADAALWGTYGALLGDFALIGYGVVLLSSATIILSRVWWTQRGDQVGDLGPEGLGFAAVTSL